MIKVNGNDGKTYGVQLEENQGAYMVRVTGDQGFSHAMEIGLDDNFGFVFELAEYMISMRGVTREHIETA